MLEHLINSKARLAILSILFKDPDRQYVAREFSKLSKLDPANLHKELANLKAGGFIKEEKIGGKKYFSANRDSRFFNGLKELFDSYVAPGKYPPLVCLEEMLNYYPLMSTMPWNVYTANSFFARFGIEKKFSCLMSTYQDNLCQLYAPKKEFKEIALAILEKIINDAAWGDKYLNSLEAAEARLYEVSRELLKMNFKEMPDHELYRIFDHFYNNIYFELHSHHWIQTVLDFDENVFSKHLLAYLREKIKKTDYSLGDVFSVLTTPTKEAMTAKEYRDLLSVYSHICANRKTKQYFINTETRLICEELPNKNPSLWDEISEHTRKFGFLGYNTAGPAWDEVYFIDILSSLARQGAPAKILLAEMVNNKEGIKKRQQQLIRDLKIDKQYVRIFKFARDLVFSKGSRKDSMFFNYLAAENLYREIGRRHYLSLRQVRYLHPHEVYQLLVKHDFETALLNERYKLSLNFSLGRYEEDINLAGAAATEFLGSLDIIKEQIDDVKILYGDCASPGRVRGTVKIINEPLDMPKMNKGDVLVSYATSPDLVPAIKKAVAIITDIGGITCHAAIISRELGIPCVIGTKTATKVLADGDVVDVNATHGKIDIIEKTKKKKNK